MKNFLGLKVKTKVIRCMLEANFGNKWMLKRDFNLVGKIFQIVLEMQNILSHHLLVWFLVNLLAIQVVPNIITLALSLNLVSLKIVSR